tara:strand:+ start:32870 stop:33133 length:264 start_codon:yes stop_codon:yes gene_type:complete
MMIVTIFGLGAYNTEEGPISIIPQGYDLVIYQGSNVGYIIFDTSEALSKYLSIDKLYKDLNEFNRRAKKQTIEKYKEVRAVYNAHKL